MERIYDELKFVDVFKKHFSEAKNSVRSAPRLKFVVFCKSHRRRIDKNNLVTRSHRKTSPTFDRE